MTTPETIDTNASQGELKDYRDNLKNSGNKIRGEEDKNIKDKDKFTEELLEKTESLQAETESLQAERESLHEKLNTQQNTIGQLNQSISEVQATIDSMKDNLNSLNFSSNNGTSYTEAQQQTESETQQTEPETQQTEPETQQQNEYEIQQQNEYETQQQNEYEIQQQNEYETQQQNEYETQQQNEYETQGYEQSYLKLDSYEGYVKALSQLIYEIEGCKKTAKYRRGLNQSGKQTLKTATEKIEQYKDIISDKKRMLEHEYKEKNKLNKKNPDKAPLTLSISSSEINELRNRWFEWRKVIEIDIKEGQNGKSSNIAPWPNQSLEQVKKGNKVDKGHIEYNSKLNAALNDTAFLHIIDNDQDKAREFLQAIANNSLSEAQIRICQARMVQLAPYFEQYDLSDQVYECIQTRGGRYNESYQKYKNMDSNTAYKTGGVAGWLNKYLIDHLPNVKPETASTVSSLMVLGAGIGAIYGIGKWFFKKDKKGEKHVREKAARVAGGGILLPALLLGKDGFTIAGELISGKFDWSEMKYRLSNMFSRERNYHPDVYNAMAPGILGMNIFPMSYTVADIRIFQQEILADPDKLKQRYTNTYNRLNKDDYALANEFKNTFSADRYNEKEWKIFLEKLGITDETDGNVKVFDKIRKVTDKKTSFAYWRKDNGKEINPEFKKEVDDYINKEGEFNPNELDPKWFKDNNNTTDTSKEEKEQTTT